MSGPASSYKPVIGLEVHARLMTATKLLCGCPNRFGDPPNTNTCPVCLGLPGALPTLNAEAIGLATRVAAALDCSIHPRSAFARKNYFYPDLPKGYQITQHAEPLAKGGRLPIGRAGHERDIGIERLHVEEDAGKTTHEAHQSLIDLNRCGSPLVEIVSGPEMRSADEAVGFARSLRLLMMDIEACDGNMHEGSLRVDANVSLRPAGARKLGTRVEMKNLNSLAFLHAALEHEIGRQSEILASGGQVQQETRRWIERERRTAPLRRKEQADDYRYFPEPDLPPLVLDERCIASVTGSLPEPHWRRARWLHDSWNLAWDTACLLGSRLPLTRYVQEAARGLEDPSMAARFIATEVLGHVEADVPCPRFQVSAADLGDLLRLLARGEITGRTAKQVYARAAGSGCAPAAIVRREGLALVRDATTIEAACRRVIEAFPDEARAWREGRRKVLRFLTGRVMEESRGTLPPREVATNLERLLEDDDKTS